MFQCQVSSQNVFVWASGAPWSNERVIVVAKQQPHASCAKSCQDALRNSSPCSSLNFLAMRKVKRSGYPPATAALGTKVTWQIWREYHVALMWLLFGMDSSRQVGVPCSCELAHAKLGFDETSALRIGFAILWLPGKLATLNHESITAEHLRFQDLVIPKFIDSNPFTINPLMMDDPSVYWEVKSN